MDSEIGQAILIESISWKRFPSPDAQGTFNDLEISLGLCASDNLVSVFEDNFISGTKTLVLSESSYTTATVGVNEWFEIPLSTPYWYSGAENLLIEIQWSDGSGSLYAWSWSAGDTRRIFGAYGSSSAAVLGDNVPTMRLNGTLSLDNSTFAQIKAAFI